jgi:hypothetical protein
MATPTLSNAITQFRQDVLKRGGPQIAAKYKVRLMQGDSSSIDCYPLSIVIPGRGFVFYPHDLWGPDRKIPYKRNYTQCHMTFIVYQDWSERTFIEQWMNNVIQHTNTSGLPATSQQAAFQTNPTRNQTEDQATNALINSLNSGALMGNAAFNLSNYDDYTNYSQGKGTVVIECLNSRLNSVSNMTMYLKESFPAQISQSSISSETGSYPTFNVTFQFNDYYYVPYGTLSLTSLEQTVAIAPGVIA